MRRSCGATGFESPDRSESIFFIMPRAISGGPRATRKRRSCAVIGWTAGGSSAARLKTAVEAALTNCPVVPPAVACAPEGRKMQPDRVVSMVQDPAQEESAKEVLTSLIGQRQFDLWFRQKTRLVVENGGLVVYAASPFHQKWLQKQHRASLVQATRVVLGPSAHLRFEVDATLSADGAAALPESTAAVVMQPRAPAPRAEAPRTLRLATASEPAPVATVRPGRRFADLRDFV